MTDISFRVCYLTLSCHVACRVLRFVPRWNWLRGGMTWVFQCISVFNSSKITELGLIFLYLVNSNKVVWFSVFLCNPNQTFSVLLIYHHQRWSGLASTASGGISLGWEADFVVEFCWTNLGLRNSFFGSAWSWGVEGNGGKMWEGALLRPNLGNDTGANLAPMTPSPSAPPVLLFGAPHLGAGDFRVICRMGSLWTGSMPSVLHKDWLLKLFSFPSSSSPSIPFHPLPSPPSLPSLPSLSQFSLSFPKFFFHIFPYLSHIFATHISASQHAGCHRRWQRWARRCPGHFANWKPWPIYRWYKWWSTYHFHGDTYIYICDDHHWWLAYGHDDECED